MLRTLAGDQERFEKTYFEHFKGYYFTGDGCRRDEDGYYWLTGIDLVSAPEDACMTHQTCCHTHIIVQASHMDLKRSKHKLAMAMAAFKNSCHIQSGARTLSYLLFQIERYDILLQQQSSPKEPTSMLVFSFGSPNIRS